MDIDRFFVSDFLPDNRINISNTDVSVKAVKCILRLVGARKKAVFAHAYAPLRAFLLIDLNLLLTILYLLCYYYLYCSGVIHIVRNLL